MPNKKYDVIVWGATGFTGKWVAKHLYDNYSQDELSWAIAGRNELKLLETKTFIGDSKDTVDTIKADSNDKDSLMAMASQTQVIITTVGPYAYYGSLLVEVCAGAGTHYVDLTGEVPWMRRMIDEHQETALRSGAKIVHCCGFDSIPFDMGNFYIQQQAKEKTGEYLNKVKSAVLKMKGGASGGTIHSIFNVMKEAMADKKIRKLMTNPYSLNPDMGFRGVDGYDQRSPIYDEVIGKWTAPFIMAGINTRVVRRSNALMGYPYGEDFSYSETMVTADGVRGRLSAISIASGYMMFAAVATTELGRKLLAKVLPSQGEGPEVDPENPGFYVIDIYGHFHGGDVLVARVKGDADPGYGSTSKMLAEAAVCLVLDKAEIGAGGGFLTPSSAMGTPLLKRLSKNAGLSFEIK